MAEFGEHIGYNVEAKEDLNAHLYFAFAANDGKIANSGAEASGIIMNKPKTGEGVDVGTVGRMPFQAGAAVAADARLTVTTSGYCITCGSGYDIIGRACAAVTSGSIGVGNFNFNTPIYAQTSDFVGT